MAYQLPETSTGDMILPCSSATLPRVLGSAMQAVGLSQFLHDDVRALDSRAV